MYPFKLEPVCKQIIWGGNRLKTEYGFKSDSDNIAEAWMLTCREDGENRVTGSSALIGDCISDEAIGTKYTPGDDFPLLIKLIDAKSDLSVQVHPDDAYAAEHEDSPGKTEAWYIIDCDEGAELIYGFRDKISGEAFRAALENDTILDIVNRVKVKKGDFFFIPAGTLHAIGSGILLAEVQQNCNTTYRVYDYNRLQDGKPRELHIDKAVDVTVTSPVQNSQSDCDTVRLGECSLRKLCECEYFSTSILELKGLFSAEVASDSFVSLLVLEGKGILEFEDAELSFKKGESIFIPAGIGKISLTGTASLLISKM